MCAICHQHPFLSFFLVTKVNQLLKEFCPARHALCDPSPIVYEMALTIDLVARLMYTETGRQLSVLHYFRRMRGGGAKWWVFFPFKTTGKGVPSKKGAPTCTLRYDLSDLVERLQWLRSHDDEAKAIALNGVTFAHRCLASGCVFFFGTPQNTS